MKLSPDRRSDKQNIQTFAPRLFTQDQGGGCRPPRHAHTTEQWPEDSIIMLVFINAAKGVTKANVFVTSMSKNHMVAVMNLKALSVARR